MPSTELATTVTSYGYNLENSSMRELLQTARQVEQSKFYIEREEKYSSRFKQTQSSKPTNSKSMKVPLKPTGSKTAPKETTKDSTPLRGKIICHNCKKPGHIAPKCPNKTTTSKAARAAHETNDEDQAEYTAEAQEGQD